MDEVWGYAGDMFVKVLNDVMDPADAVVEATALINEVNGK
jgi:arabinogalactan oligomer/maltooligosaccharide transport system substrate-binding protein